MLPAIRFGLAITRAGSYAPDFFRAIERQPRRPPSEQDLPAHFTQLSRTRVPHHAGAPARVAECVDQRLDDSAAILRFALRKDRMLDGRTKRQTLDALRGPIGGDFLTTHTPHLFGVGFEENPK